MSEKENRGGYRPGSGRKRKAVDLNKIRIFDGAIEPKHLDEMLKKLAHKAITEGDVKAAQFLWEARFGKPHQGIDHTTNGKDLPAAQPQLIFCDTVLSEADLEEIREIELGIKTASGNTPAIEIIEIK